jgi:sugar phosphate isomerase/epimerase
VRTPPRHVLADRYAAARHATALRGALAGTGLRLVLHAPDDLRASTREHEIALDGLLDYAARAEAPLVAYHGANFDQGEWWAGHGAAEERALAARADRARRLGITLAIENLCPVFPGAARMSHDPLVVRDLVRRIGHPAIGMLLDVGHAHVATGAVSHVLDEVGGDVVLFHLHDNLGNDTGPRPARLDPLRLDLHLAPGAGTVPWGRIAARLAAHGAPLVGEVAPQHRLPPPDLAELFAAALSRPVRT